MVESAPSSGTDRTVVGVDGGGTTTRVIVADESGTVLATAEGGGANPQHNPESAARSAVHETIGRALDAAGRTPADVDALTAGFAGLNDDEDREWARSFADVPGLACDPVCVNDAVVAHAGALEGEPGIVPICGTGSIVFAVTGDGRQLRNYDLEHYARAAARHLGGRALRRVLADGRTGADADLIDRLFDEWDVDGVEELRTRAVDGALASTETSENALDSVAPVITARAADGSPLAQSICDDAVAEVTAGVRALAGYFDERPIRVAPMGSVLRSPHMLDALGDALDEAPRTYRIVDPAMNGAAGAVLLGLRRLDGPAAAAERLRPQPECRP